MKKIVTGIAVLFLLVIFVFKGLETSADSTAKVRVGAASESVLPLVDGSLDYFTEAELPDEYDTDSMGVFVERFDDGQIVVGNGGDDAHWVRDDIRVSAMAIENKTDNKMVTILTSNLYMIFKSDAELIRQEARKKLEKEGIDHRNLDMIITADHNHHGPDTAWAINRKWYSYMIDKATDAIVNAIKSREDAVLHVGEGEHWYGLMDSRDPQIIDPTMNVLQAKDMSGDVISTLVLWNAHPEMTLGVEFKVDNLEEICAQDYWNIEDCTTKGQYLTSDFVGPMGEVIQNKIGGEFLFLQGPLGGQMSHRYAPLWEISEEHGIGDSFTPPAGAELITEKRDERRYYNDSFRRQIVVGQQAGIAALNIIKNGEEITNPTITYKVDKFYLRLTNTGFSFLSLLNDGKDYSDLGYRPMDLYICSDNENKTDETCVHDNFETVEDPVLKKVRKGDHLLAEVAYLQIGNMGMILTPAEMMSELVIGFPKGFLENPGRWFEKPDDMKYHATDDYEIPGYVKNRMNDKYKWVVSLGNDELGYAVPMSDFRIGCAADKLVKEGTCLQLYEEGLIQYEDGLSGKYCKLITEHPEEIADLDESIQQALVASCRYGQANFRAKNHYHETMSASWDLADEILASVARLTGNDSDKMVNEALPGYWYGNPPPAVEPPVIDESITIEEAEQIVIDKYGGIVVDSREDKDKKHFEIEVKNSAKGHIIVTVDAKTGDILDENMIEESEEPEEPEEPKQLLPVVYANVTKSNNEANIDDKDVDLIDHDGELVIELRDSLEKINQISFTEEQIKLLIERNVKIIIEKDDMSLEIPTANFIEGPLIIEINKLKEENSNIDRIEQAKSSVYDFVLKQGNTIINEFKENVRLFFKVTEEIEDEDALAMYYWNEAKQKWKNIGGKYKDNHVIATTDHFSTFGVFEKVEESSNGGTPKKDEEPIDTNGKPKAQVGKKLPSTATNIFNGMLIGGILLIVGVIIYYVRARKIQKSDS